jgi:hypothetical protein
LTERKRGRAQQNEPRDLCRPTVRAISGKVVGFVYRNDLSRTHDVVWSGTARKALTSWTRRDARWFSNVHWEPSGQRQTRSKPTDNTEYWHDARSGWTHD